MRRELDYAVGGKNKNNFANPGLKSFSKIIKYNLEVVIHNCRLLDFYISKDEHVNVHLKFNTGMNRYGFDQKDLNFVIDRLKNNSKLKCYVYLFSLVIS